MPPSSGAGPPGVPRFDPNLKLKLTTINKEKGLPSKISVFETVFKTLNAQLTKLIPITDGFIAITDSSKSKDTLSSNRGTSELAKLNLRLSESREQIAHKTLFIKQVDSVAGSHSADDIKAELIRNHSWLGNISVFKIKQFTHIFKLTCPNTATTDRILQEGLTLFYTRISPSQITREKFTPIKTCFKCYKANDHDTNDCKATTLKCSNCSLPGHTHTNCTATEKTCLNCPPPNNKHSTMYHSCPYRLQQQKLSEQQKQRKTIAQTQATYKDIVRTTLEETKTQSQHLTLTSDIHLKLVACIIEAHVAAFFKAGEYHTLLTDNLKKNFDLEMTFSPRNQSDLINLNNRITSILPDSINMPAPQLPPKPAREPRRRDLSLPRPNTQQPMDTNTEPTVTSNLETWHKVERRHRDSSDSTKNKRKLNTSPLQLKPSEINIYKLNTDNTPVPSNPPQDWFMEQYRKGKLKFAVKHDRFQEICAALGQEKPPFQFHTDSIIAINEKDFNKIDNIVGYTATQTTQQGKKQHK